MAAEQSKPKGPDLARGRWLGNLVDGGMIGGHVGDDAVLLARRGDELFAIGATCSHYGGPLAEGLIVGDTVRCPWHHACFSLRTGEALAAPALQPDAVLAGGDGATARLSCARKIEPRRSASLPEPAARAARPHRDRGRRARPDLPRPRCCGAKDLPAA